MEISRSFCTRYLSCEFHFSQSESENHVTRFFCLWGKRGLPDAVSTSDKAQLPSCADMCDVRSHISLVSFVSYWHKVSVMCPQRHKGFRCNSTTYLLTYRCKRFYHCDCVSSDTSSSTSLSGTRGSSPVPTGCVQQRHNRVLIPSYSLVRDNTMHQHWRRWRKEVMCMCSLCSVATH